MPCNTYRFYLCLNVIVSIFVLSLSLQLGQTRAKGSRIGSGTQQVTLSQVKVRN